ncbi:MAG: response regulator, partial [Verrucomicrobiaceae bacterium]
MGTAGNDTSPTLDSPTLSTQSASGEQRKFSNVLLVDDSKFLADILAMFFQLDGYTAKAAYSGEQAVAFIAEEVPDIAFVDIDMPGMN